MLLPEWKRRRSLEDGVRMAQPLNARLVHAGNITNVFMYVNRYCREGSRRGEVSSVRRLRHQFPDYSRSDDVRAVTSSTIS